MTGRETTSGINHQSYWFHGEHYNALEVEDEMAQSDVPHEEMLGKRFKHVSR